MSWQRKLFWTSLSQESVGHGTASTMSALKPRTFRSRDCKARIQPWESRWLLRAKLAA
ncbi:MAG: hypothetical protein DMF19_14340 [Verrucomicrobia bacterium]|nr:MAG: hypothetical protein DMF19_14340 [Verrucomicrobiota bacterium]